MSKIEEVWAIRLSNNGQKYLTSFKPRGLRWGSVKNAKTFYSKYSAKQIYSQIKDVAACEMYRLI